MLELGIGSGILTALGLAYWAFALIALWLAWKFPDWFSSNLEPSKLTKWIPVAVVVALFGYLPGQVWWKQHQSAVRHDEAKAVFDEKCKSAGERIYKTAEEVEGILLPKIREKRANYLHDLRDPLWSDAAMHGENQGDEYIRSFLLDRRMIEVNMDRRMGRRIVFDVGGPGERGFRYVDVVGATDGKRYRVTATAIDRGNFNKDIVLDKVVAIGPPPRFAVNFENNVDPELRKYWVAGTTIKVVDTQTNETMGELELWNFDRSQGNTNQSSPWSTSTFVCPEPPDGSYPDQTHKFVEKILKAKQGN